MDLDFWDTPIFSLLTLEYPDLAWYQPTATLIKHGGEVVRVVTTGPLTTL